MEEKKDVQSRLVENKSEINKEEVTDTLKIISPGTLLRTAIEGIQKTKTGGLIVAYNDFMSNLFEGGFKINIRSTPQRLIELSKMDGAILLSKDFKKILYANVLLTPNNSIPSNETGTRHKAAERIAKQANTTALIVSQRRDEMVLFHKGLKYVIKDSNEIMRRATGILQILEKHKEFFEKNKAELDEEELKRKPKISKITSLVQRGIMILKISETLKGYIIELGVEGIIVKTRLKELLHKLEKEVDEVLKDYSKLGLTKSKRILSMLSYEELLEIDNIKQCIGLSDNSEINPKGHRILGKSGILEEDIIILIKNFKNLQNILEAKKEDLIPFFEEQKINEILGKIKNSGELN